MRNSASLALVLFLVPARLFAESPLSAIDWLTQSPPTPSQAEQPQPGLSAMPGNVATAPLDTADVDAAGLLTPRQTGLPQNLWGPGRADDIAERVATAPANSLPAVHELTMSLLLAEAWPPGDQGRPGTLFFARVDKLVQLGALDQAQALLDVSGARGAEAFRRRFDIALLQGTETRACGVLNAAPQLAPGYPARIYCLARSGDWQAAATILHSARTLGIIDSSESDLIARFLDPDLFEGEPSLSPPQRPTPIDWRMFEAIGEPLPTFTLPIAFAHAELRDTAGWKAQIEAAERLAHAGVLDPNQLLDFYTRQSPAASGGLWDRVAAIQALDSAIAAKDTRLVAQALPIAFSQMQRAELEVTLARIYAEALVDLPLTGEAASFAFRLGLIADLDPSALQHIQPRDAEERFLWALFQGNPGSVPSIDGLSRAITAATTGKGLSDEAADLLARHRQGEAILYAVDRISRGIQGDLRGVTEGLATLHALGMEPAVRKIALQMMILDRRG
ncbi:hypothetical protein [Falsirhodobacter sp. alg1]|uniref:hypothetical protein n=1 Tax=Falsirhodobacter sp. alg1 TaxID=1472418 RepID=UPI000788F244|nr:hypothetical protein [Falsirhodobacter sp. alg1]